jgi:hypothetical protein
MRSNRGFGQTGVMQTSGQTTVVPLTVRVQVHCGDG